MINSYLENQSRHFHFSSSQLEMIHDIEIEKYQLNLVTCKDLFDQLIDEEHLSSHGDHIIDQITEPNLPTHQQSSQGCKCSKIDCLKMYCECFSKGRLCTDKCDCSNCCNHPKCEMEIRRAQQIANFKRPGTFNGVSALVSIRKCTCKKSECKKNYCDCYRSGMKCSQECECIACQNGRNGLTNFFISRMEVEVNV